MGWSSELVAFSFLSIKKNVLRGPSPTITAGPKCTFASTSRASLPRWTGSSPSVPSKVPHWWDFVRPSQKGSVSFLARFSHRSISDCAWEDGPIRSNNSRRYRRQRQWHGRTARDDVGGHIWDKIVQMKRSPSPEEVYACIIRSRLIVDPINADARQHLWFPS